jgi:hypothetical protein
MAGTMVKMPPSGIAATNKHKDILVHAYPNPTQNKWRLVFQSQIPANYQVTISNTAGQVITTQSNTDVVDATSFPAGVYTIDISSGTAHYSLKAIKE